jgi:hypothetical protein
VYLCQALFAHVLFRVKAGGFSGFFILCEIRPVAGLFLFDPCVDTIGGVKMHPVSPFGANPGLFGFICLCVMWFGGCAYVRVRVPTCVCVCLRACAYVCACVCVCVSVYYILYYIINSYREI